MVVLHACLELVYSDFLLMPDFGQDDWFSDTGQLVAYLMCFNCVYCFIFSQFRSVSDRM